MSTESHTNDTMMREKMTVTTDAHIYGTKMMMHVQQLSDCT